MRLVKLLGAFLFTSLLASAALAQTQLPQFPITGPSLIEGSKLNAMVDYINALAGGGKIKSGAATLDGANPTPVATGLTSITSCTVALGATTAPGVGTSVVTIGKSSGTLNLYAWKVTSTTDTTLIASTDNTSSVNWVCVGN